jgi:hypothetical protein
LKSSWLETKWALFSYSGARTVSQAGRSLGATAEKAVPSLRLYHKKRRSPVGVRSHRRHDWRLRRRGFLPLIRDRECRQPFRLLLPPVPLLADLLKIDLESNSRASARAVRALASARAVSPPATARSPVPFPVTSVLSQAGKKG